MSSRAGMALKTLKQRINEVLRQENGQDLIEYTLLLALIALAGAATFGAIGRSISSIWTVVNGRLASAASGQ
ncbi:MAG: Flp family type IVb pilin [Bryobacteraceae bacterium]